MSSTEQKTGRLKFLILQGYQGKDGSRDAKRRRSSFIMHVKESVSVNSSMF